jgi:CRP-like cAMP-binding protein
MVFNQIPNLLLAALSPASRNSFMARLETVTLPARQILFEPGETPKYAHFITSGIASIITPASNGAGAEIDILGKEGLVESFHLLGTARTPTRCIIRVEGSALRMPFKELQKEFRESAELRNCVLHGVQIHTFILGQLVTCNLLHGAEERLARWLLTILDRTERDTLYVTQECLANVLGLRRTTVTEVAGRLRRKGLIKFSHGHIRIVDPLALKIAACECYSTVRDLYLNFYRGIGTN